jgi:hypothetical protein
MRPRADEILRSVVATFDTYIAPEVRDPFAQSLALTLSNLMRNVALRIGLEGQALFDDNAQLRGVLEHIRVYVDGRLDDRFAACTKEIGEALRREHYGPGVYPSLALVTEEATDLRWTLQHAIRELEAARPELGEEPEYEELRREIRRYLRASLEREMAFTVPAFTGERR